MWWRVIEGYLDVYTINFRDHNKGLFYLEVENLSLPRTFEGSPHTCVHQQLKWCCILMM
ncbi:hypothetical protein HanRHA438_Chr11g0495021 [Helianthus annuus]|nr:hypothetical protein HanRHA438_Chr11g0495021 [Helianthus annuus]